ncbi:MAG: hypothetical protein PHG89_11585 [Gallionella sp.]|nr:hypothetical protein [Gallionella sp.]
MMNLTKLLKHLTFGMALASVPMLGGCGDNTLTWQEEIKLSDGRVITITQKRRYESVYTGSNYGNLPREYWLIFKLPEFGNKEITWHENLLPQVLNVYQGKFYVVGTPFTEVEFRQYGKPFPEYVPYRYEAGQWQRIPFNEIPEAIYETNLWIDTEPENNSKYISLTDKAVEMKDDRLRDHTKRISATYKSPH